MLAEVLLALAAVHSPAHVPAPVATPRALVDADVRVVLQANETHFVATNTGFDPVVLVFGLEDLGPLTACRLAPGQQAVWGHAGGDETQLWVEAISLHPTRTDSGAFQVQDIASQGGALWLVHRCDALEGFRESQNERGVLRAEPEGDLLAHVPGGPAPRPLDDAPPVVGGGPLPVV